MMKINTCVEEAPISTAMRRLNTILANVTATQARSGDTLAMCEQVQNQAETVMEKHDKCTEIHDRIKAKIQRGPQ